MVSLVDKWFEKKTSDMGGSSLCSEHDMGTRQAPYCCGKPGLQFDTSTALRCKSYAELCS